MDGLKGKNVLVTGAASGIGAATVRRFAEEGANVAINYHRLSTKKDVILLERAIKKFGDRVVGIRADISQMAEARQLVRKAKEKLGGLDVLVNNAGIQIESSASHLTKDKDFLEVLNTDLLGAWACSSEAIKYFLPKRKGNIINVSSIHQFVPKPGYISYSVSKGGMGNLTSTLALEYADKGIRVNAVAPGAILTPINKRWKDNPRLKAMVSSHIPMGRAGRPEEVAAAIVWLASSDASYVTGHTVVVSGDIEWGGFKTAWSS